MSSPLPRECHGLLPLVRKWPALLAADPRVVAQVRRGRGVVEVGEEREGDVSREERVGQRIAAFVLERGTHERLASLARQGAERLSSAARVRVERGKL